MAGMEHAVGTIRVEPLDATFGAVVHDVVLAGASDETVAELTELWLEYALLIFPGQHLTQQEQDDFARRFGDLEFTATPLTNIQRGEQPDWLFTVPAGYEVKEGNLKFKLVDSAKAKKLEAASKP